ncbi:hypothetical protein HY745_00600 [Candidatus Desantisbacteria bacterium]|nr:hypothetical protein [Candidatus Desantisbacteria bacterium]
MRLSFKKHILPIFRNKCAPCHIPGETRTRIVTKSDFEGEPSTVIDHSNSLDLTSYNGSSVIVNGKIWSKRGIKDMALDYKKNPDMSPVLLKTRNNINGNITHAGGVFWKVTDTDYKMIRLWITEGAKDN